MTNRLLLVVAAAALFLVACGTDDTPYQSDAQSQLTEQSAQVQAQSQGTSTSEATDPQRQATRTDQRQQQQSTASTAAQSSDTEFADQSQQVQQVQQIQQDQEIEQQTTAAGPAAPEFDFEIAIRYLNHLAGELGPRASGTEQELAAADYLVGAFTQLGYDTRIQTFEFTGAPSISRLDIDTDSPTYGFRFPGSSANGLTGTLVRVPGVGEQTDFDQVETEGKIALVNRGIIEFRQKAANARDAGAAALIIANTRTSDSIGGTFGAFTVNIPVLHVSLEAGNRLNELIGEHITIPEATPSTGNSQNVIARKPDSTCRVIVGGHYDTVPEVDGANDNASGTALTLALAEIWASHPASADICFVAFGAEELGLFGSREFVKMLGEQGQLDEVTAMLNLDAIGDGRAPYRIIASAELRSLGDTVAAELQINAASGSLPMDLGSDHASFVAEGILAIFLFPPGAIIHTPADNLDNINRDVFGDIATLNHGLLACLLQRAGSPVAPATACESEESPS